MNHCPCCSDPMLLYAGNHQEYWFCRTCWQEMPLLTRLLVDCPIEQPIKQPSLTSESMKSSLTLGLKLGLHLPTRKRTLLSI